MTQKTESLRQITRETNTPIVTPLFQRSESFEDAQFRSIVQRIQSNDASLKEVRIIKLHMSNANWTELANAMLQNNKVTCFYLLRTSMSEENANVLLNVLSVRANTASIPLHCLGLNFVPWGSNNPIICSFLAKLLSPACPLQHSHSPSCYIRALSLRGTNIQMDGNTNRLVIALRRASILLEELDLSATGLDDSSLIFILHTLFYQNHNHHNHTSFRLWKLCLDGNHHVGINGIRAVAGLLRCKTKCQIRANHSLKELHMDGMQLTPAGCTEIAISMAQNEFLQKLTLHSNSIDIEGAKAMAYMIRHNKNLRHLDLTNNLIMDGGCIHIANALCHNCTLKELQLDYNQIYIDGKHALAEVLRTRNYTLCTIGLLGNNCIDPQDRKAIKTNLIINRDRPVCAEVTKTGMFPHRLMSKLLRSTDNAANASIYVEAICRIVQFGNLSASFCFVREHPSFFTIYPNIRRERKRQRTKYGIVISRI